MPEENIVKPVVNAIPAPEPEQQSKVEQAEVLTDKPAEEKPVAGDSLIPTDDYLTSPLWYEVVNYLGIPQPEWNGAKNEVSVVVDYIIQDIKSNDPDKILPALRALEDRIERPEWGTSRYKNLYRYIRLAAKKQSIQQAMGAFEKKGVNHG